MNFINIKIHYFLTKQKCVYLKLNILLSHWYKFSPTTDIKCHINLTVHSADPLFIRDINPILHT